VWRRVPALTVSFRGTLTDILGSSEAKNAKKKQGINETFQNFKTSKHAWVLYWRQTQIMTRHK
jgi:hypothetical protein